MDRDAVDSYAAQISFWVFISFIPFLMFVLILLQIIHIENTSLLFMFADLLPEPVEQMFHFLFSEIKAPSGILSMTAITCIWSASNGMLAMVKGFYSVFDVSRKRNFVIMRILAIFYTLALIVTLLLCIGILVFGDLFQEWLSGYISTSVTNILSSHKSLLIFFILLLLFWLMFIAIPRKRVSLKNAFFGSVFAASGWVLFSFFFSIFVENFSHYATIYGSLAAIVILMMWLYICMYILLLGGEISMWLQNSNIQTDLRTLYLKRPKHAAQKGNLHGKKSSK